MRIYALKSCDTCKKAQKALEAEGHVLEVVDVRADGVSRADLERFRAAFGDALVNTRSTTWRGLDEDARKRDPIDLLVEHPTLMKRPVIDDGTLYLGWSKDVQAKLLSG